MIFEQVDNGNKGYFRAVENDTEAGRMTYKWSGITKLIIDHTDVKPNFKGKNVGKQLVMEAVHYARKKSLKIVPQCPFAKSVFDKNVEIQDVIAK